MGRSRLAVCIACIALLSASAVLADIITDWNSLALDIIRQSGTSPPVASRALAMIHAAAFNAVNATDLTYQAYHSYQTAIPGSSAEAAAAAAARDVLAQIYPTYTTTLDAAMAASLAPIADGASKTNGLSLGHATASDIIAWRATDSWSLVIPYTPGTDPGEWRPTPPAYAPALLTNWPLVDCFVMTSGSQFRGSGPPPLDSFEYAESYNDTKTWGAVNSAARNAYQTETAFFWADGAGTSTPPGHWNKIAQVVAQQQGNSLLENARLFALLNISLADAGISAWDNKYAYNLWRPISAIQLADPGINPLTIPDPDWLPLQTTPNFPEYVSGHSTFSGAAAQILADFFGTDDITFTIGSEGLPGVTRTYTSFSEAAEEAGRSRIYGGIHFDFSDGPAGETGQSIGMLAYGSYMQPIPETSTFVLAVMSGLCGLAGAGRRWLGSIRGASHRST